MLRAVRFAATYDFALDDATLQAIRSMADEATQVSGERVGAELRRILTHGSRARGRRCWRRRTCCGRCCRSWRRMRRRMTRRGGRRWGVWTGSIRPTVPLAFAALLHGMVDLEQVRVLGRRLRLSNKELDRTIWLLQQLPAMLDAATLPWPRLQRLLVHEGSGELLALAEVILPAGDAGIARCREQLTRPPVEWNPPPLVSGDDLMRRGVKPGRQFAALLEHLRDEQLEGRIRTQDEAVAAARVWLENAGNVGGAVDDGRPGLYRRSPVQPRPLAGGSAALVEAVVRW